MVRRRLALVAPPIVVGVIAFVAMRLTMLPGVDFWDTAELQTVAPILGTAHPTGFPTYVLLGWVMNALFAPFGEPAFRMNLFAAISVAIAVGLTVDLVRVLTRSIPLGVFAGLGLAFTEIVWSIGTHAEAHSLHLLLVVLLFRSLVGWELSARGASESGVGGHGDGGHGDGGHVGVGDGGHVGVGGGVGHGGSTRDDRWLIAAAVVFGLSMGNHSLTLLLAPAVGLYVLAVDPRIWRRPRLVVGCVVALLGTMALVFLELPLRAGPFRAALVYGRPETWDGFWYVVLAEQFRGSLVAPFTDIPAKIAALVDRTVAGFGPLAVLLPIGLVATIQIRPRYALLSGVSLAITVFFAASYVNADIGRYYLVPAFIAWTWLAMLAAAIASAVRIGDARVDGGGSDRPGTETTGRASVLRPTTWVAVALAIVLLIPTGLAIGGRWTRVDRSHDRAAALWLDRALDAMAPDAVVVSWWSYSTPLWYAQHVEGRRPDITIIDDRTRLDQDLGDIFDVIDANLPTRPVYVMRADPKEQRELAERYLLERVLLDASSLTRVIGPREVGG